MAPKGLVFAPFWSEIGFGFRGSHGSVWTYLSFPFQRSKKEREICEFGMQFLEVFFCCCSNLSNERSGLKMGMDFRGQVWKRVWKMTFIYRTGWHTPTKNSQEYPWGCGRVKVLILEDLFARLILGAIYINYKDKNIRSCHLSTSTSSLQNKAHENNQNWYKAAGRLSTNSYVTEVRCLSLVLL